MLGASSSSPLSSKTISCHLPCAELDLYSIMCDNLLCVNYASAPTKFFSPASDHRPHLIHARDYNAESMGLFGELGCTLALSAEIQCRYFMAWDSGYGFGGKKYPYDIGHMQYMCQVGVDNDWQLLPIIYKYTVSPFRFLSSKGFLISGLSYRLVASVIMTR